MAGINLRGETSGSIEIQSPAVAGDNTIILPNSNGTANQFFKNSTTAGIVTYSSMIEDASGNVGIGTDAPTHKLVVKGNNDGIRIEDGNATDGYNIIRHDSTGIMHFVGDQTTYSGYRFFTNNTDERLTILNNGNIGIGTDNPTEKVTVGSAVSTALLEIKPQTGAIDINVSSGDFAPHYQDNFVIYKGQPGSGSEKLRITSDGDVEIANGNLVLTTSGTGIDFSATGNGGGTADSELLDDYEEGQWTPDLQFGGAKVGITYANQYGRYVKIGRLVHVFGRVNISNTGSSSGNARFYGLPYVTETISGTNMNIGSVWYSGFSLQGSIVQVVMRTDGNGSSFIEPKGVTTNSEDAIGDSDFINGTDMCFSVTYRTS